MKTLSVLRNSALKILDSAIKSANPYEAVKRSVALNKNTLIVQKKRYNLKNFGNIYLIGAGKASALMSLAIYDILKDRIKSGIICVNRYPINYIKNQDVLKSQSSAVSISPNLFAHFLVYPSSYIYPIDSNFSQRISIHEASHPIPDEWGCAVARDVVNLLLKVKENDLIICLLSGGGSALLPLPVYGVTLEENQILTNLLLKSGANIQEINTVRKHISQIKGGNLARLAYPATIITLVLSDVVGDDLSTIASGPTVPDDTTYQDVVKILEKYSLMDDVPESIKKYIENGIAGKIPETPKSNDPIFDRCQNVLVGNNLLALNSAKEEAESLGFNTIILSSSLQGESRVLAKFISSVAMEVMKSGNPINSPACIISGGESTVAVKGKGKGGRNHEFVLSSAIEISGKHNIVVLSAGTDGIDGNTDSAGAICDNLTIKKSEGLGLNPDEYLNNNDSYNFFKRLDDLIITGPTNTNVMDLQLVLVG